MDEKETKRRELYELAKDNGLDVHHRAGIDKIQEALIEAGISFEAFNDDSAEAPAKAEILGMNNTDPDVMDEQDELADLRDQLSEAEAAAESDKDPHVARLREQLAAKIEHLDKKVARNKAAAVRKADRVECTATAKFHVQKTDLGLRDHQGASEKVKPGQKLLLPVTLAETLRKRGQVAF